jgi:Flp pilus assembly pilin Flp
MGGEVMKIAMKRLIRDEKGAAMVLAVILLLVGGLIAAPLLAHMGTGVIAGEVYERRTAELYAADAGVEYAIWRIQSNNLTFDEDNHAYLGPLPVNGRSVQVEIYREDLDPTCGEELRYQILSTAVTDDGGGTADISGTAIESYVSASYMDFSSMLDNAIVSDNSIIIHNNVDITGNVTSGGSVTTPGGDLEDVDGTVTEDADLNWPSSAALSAYYLNQVEGGVSYYGDTLIDLEGNSCPLGPIYVEGKLDITSSDQHQEVTLTLSDTIYITGDTQVYGPTNDEPSKLTIDLNGQTIFVASPSSKSRTPPDAKPALSIEKCNIIGSGCIIAVGDVYFAPKGEVGGENDFVLVMSIEGTTTLQPSGTFYGCIAGNLCVDVSSGLDATINNSGLAEGPDLNFPVGVGDDPNELPTVTGVSVESWEISQQ